MNAIDAPALIFDALLDRATVARAVRVLWTCQRSYAHAIADVPVTGHERDLAQWAYLVHPQRAPSDRRRGWSADYERAIEFLRAMRDDAFLAQPAPTRLQIDQARLDLDCARLAIAIVEVNAV